MIFAMSRYESAGVAPPSEWASSASRTNSASRSGSAYTATLPMPASLHARITRTAISPRFAIRTFCNGFVSGTYDSCSSSGSPRGRVSPAGGARGVAHVSYRRGVQRYTSSDEDSARWETFPFRSGDIVVSTRSKSGTTWVQMICALLVHGPDLPAPLGELSPWLDHAVAPLDRVVGRLEGQPYRRIIKTHTPLDGVPIDPRATYLVVGRHPLDLAVSLYHQGDNIDRERVAELTGVPVRRATRPALHEWLVEWTRDETTPQERMDSLVGVVHHAA